jgi:uncharacterized alkaline shock family protein YloU
MIQNGVLVVVIALTLKETRGDTKLHSRAKMIRRATGDDRYTAEIDLEAENFGDLLVQSRYVILQYRQMTMLTLCDHSVKAVHLLVTEPVLFAFGLW